MATWPHFHDDHPALKTDGAPLQPGDHLDTANVFVRCHDCHGAGGEHCSCEGTGFDWTDTVDVRRTIEEATGE